MPVTQNALTFFFDGPVNSSSSGIAFGDNCEWEVGAKGDYCSNLMCEKWNFENSLPFTCTVFWNIEFFGTSYDGYFTTEGSADTTPPLLVSSNPLNGATNVPVSSRAVSFTFNEPMVSGYYRDLLAVKWSNNIDTTSMYQVWSSDKKTITFILGNDFPPNATITWLLNPVDKPYLMDLAGNPLPADTYYGSFTTQ